MTLTGLELEFLLRLSIEPWISPPLFDHSLVVRLVEAGYVQTEALPTGSVRYEITLGGPRCHRRRLIANPHGRLSCPRQGACSAPMRAVRRGRRIMPSKRSASGHHT
jgi:hypothetical protein